MKRIIRYLLQGLLITIPVAITGWVMYKLFITIAGLFTDIGLIVHPYLDPFLVILAVLGIVILIGALGSSFVFKPFFDLFDHALEKTPLVKTIYSAIKDLVSAFVGTKKRFNKPVIVTLNPAAGLQQLGFITQDNLGLLGLAGHKVAVYLPHSYAFSGIVYIVPVEQVAPLNMSAAEVMKFIVSGGVTDLD